MSLVNQAMGGFALGFGFALVVGLMNGLSTRVFPSGKTIEAITAEKFGNAVNGGQ